MVGEFANYYGEEYDSDGTIQRPPIKSPRRNTRTGRSNMDLESLPEVSNNESQNVLLYVMLALVTLILLISVATLAVCVYIMVWVDNDAKTTIDRLRKVSFHPNKSQQIPVGTSSGNASGSDPNVVNGAVPNSVAGAVPNNVTADAHLTPDPRTSSLQSVTVPMPAHPRQSSEHHDGNHKKAIDYARVAIHDAGNIASTVGTGGLKVIKGTMYLIMMLPMIINALMIIGVLCIVIFAWIEAKKIRTDVSNVLGNLSNMQNDINSIQSAVNTVEGDVSGLISKLQNLNPSSIF
ncbi:unnamed protein product [Sphagnum troendelagicum]